jgi:hypothetical protein
MLNIEAAIALATPTVFHVTGAGRAGAWSQATEHKLGFPSRRLRAGQLHCGTDGRKPDRQRPYQDLKPLIFFRPFTDLLESQGISDNFCSVVVPDH